MTRLEFESGIDESLKKSTKYLLSRFNLNSNDLNDILQNSALKAYKNLSSFKGKCAFDTWFIAICINEAKTFFKKQSKQNYFQDVDSINNDINVSRPPEIESSTQKDEYSKIIYDNLNKLSEKHQEIIKIILRNTHSCEEIAKKLKIPTNSVRTRIFYAKKHLKKLIQAYAHKSNIKLFNY